MRSVPSLSPDVLEYTANLQKDGRLLLRHLIRRWDCALPDVVPVGTAIDGTPSDVLFVDPETIVADASKISELVNSVDLLSRRAAPANVRSIRLTSAYLNMNVEGGEPPDVVKSEARRIYWWMVCLGVIAAIMFLATVGLLAHADHGRRLLLQVESLQRQQKDIYRELSQAPDAEFTLMPKAQPSPRTNGRVAGPVVPAATPGKSAPFCRPAREAAPASAGAAGSQWLEPATAKTIDLCRQQDDLNGRLALTRVELADWNCLTHGILPPFVSAPPRGVDASPSPNATAAPAVPIATGALATPNTTGAAAVPDPADACGQPRGGLSKADLRAWLSHDARVSASYAVMSGFVLPMLLGFLGGCAYAFRRLDAKLAAWTLEPQDGKHAVVRVCLAAMLGGLVGVIWSSDENVTLGGFTLSLAATAFFIGFSVEAVFRLIQTLIDTVASSLRTPAPPSVALSPPMSESQMRRIAKEASSVLEFPQGAGADTDMPGPPSAAVPATQAGLSELKDRLTEQKQALTAMVQLGKGSPVAVDAPALIGSIDTTLASIQPLLSGKPDAVAIATVVGQASETLAKAQNAGLPGLLADGIATVKGATDLLGPVIAGIPAGPVGIVAGIVLGGLQLAQNEQKFQALKAALLRQPFDPSLRPRVPDAVTALAALEASPLMNARVTNAKQPSTALALMQRLVERDAAGDLPSAGSLAFALIQPGDPLGLATQFASAAELAAAIEEYRSGLVFVEASKRLDGNVSIPETASTPASSFGFQALVNSVLGLHADPRASAAIERTVAITEALAKLPAGPQAAIDLVRRSLGAAASIARQDRQVGQLT